MPNPLTPIQRLTLLVRRLNSRDFESIAANRDPATGVFKTGGSITGKSLRAAWSGTPARNAIARVRGAAVDPRAAFKSKLLADLRAPRV